MVFLGLDCGGEGKIIETILPPPKSCKVNNCYSFSFVGLGFPLSAVFADAVGDFGEFGVCDESVF